MNEWTITVSRAELEAAPPLDLTRLVTTQVVRELFGPAKPPELWLMHPATYAEVVGVRRTRAGRHVYRGRSYRSRTLALRRAPKVFEIPEARVTAMMDGDGVVARASIAVMRRDIMADRWCGGGLMVDGEAVEAHR